MASLLGSALQLQPKSVCGRGLPQTAGTLRAVTAVTVMGMPFWQQQRRPLHGPWPLQKLLGMYDICVCLYHFFACIPFFSIHSLSSLVSSRVGDWLDSTVTAETPAAL